MYEEFKLFEKIVKHCADKLCDIKTLSEKNNWKKIKFLNKNVDKSCMKIKFYIRKGFRMSDCSPFLEKKKCL